MMILKTIMKGMTLAGTLLASASVVKAEAFMELISGGSMIQVTGPVGRSSAGNYEGVSGNDAIFVGTIGSWSVDIATGGNSGGFNVTLIDDINGATTQTDGLEVVFSSGSYNLHGLYNFGASDSGGNSLTATVSGFYSGTLFTGHGSMGTSLGSWTLGKTYADTFQNTDIPLTGAKFITEEMVFGGGTGPITPQNVTMNACASFTDPPVPDGGMTAAMVGATLLGLAGFRSKFCAKLS
jgi:hypothetical protein